MINVLLAVLRNRPRSRALIRAGAAFCRPAYQEDKKMPTPQDTFRNAANSPAARQAADKARSMAEDAGDAAERFSDKAGAQFAKAQDRAQTMAADAQDMAIDAYDEAHAAVRRNPLAAIGIALGIGFLFGALTTARR